MARIYNIIGENQTLANQPVTLIGLRPGTTAALEIVRMWIAQSANATSAQQRVQWGRQAAALATVVAATPTKIVEGDPVSLITGGTALAAGTCGINASAEGAGTKTPIGGDAFNVLGGWTWLPSPDDRIVLAPSSASSFYLFLPVAPATLTNWTFGLTFREIG